MLLAILAKTGDNPLGGVTDFFQSTTFDVIVKFVGFFFLVLWLALVFWTFKDARRRIADPILIGVSVVTALVFPFVGALIYTILRPPEYLDDVRERELEIRAMERRLTDHLRCGHCGGDVEADFISCPFCTQRLRETCGRCRSPLKPEWRICPHCEAPVARSTQSVELYETEH